MIVTAIILLSMLVTKGTSEWIFENWYLVLIFAITFMVSIGGTMKLDYFGATQDTTTQNGGVGFHQTQLNTLTHTQLMD